MGDDGAQRVWTANCLARTHPLLNTGRLHSCLSRVIRHHHRHLPLGQRNREASYCQLAQVGRSNCDPLAGSVQTADFPPGPRLNTRNFFSSHSNPITSPTPTADHPPTSYNDRKKRKAPPKPFLAAAQEAKQNVFFSFTPNPISKHPPRPRLLPLPHPRPRRRPQLARLRWPSRRHPLLPPQTNQ